MLLSSSPFSSVVCSTIKAPPTGVGDVLQRIQSAPLRSCARKFLLTQLRVHEIKKWIRVKNESGFRQPRLRVHGALIFLVIQLNGEEQREEEPWNLGTLAQVSVKHRCKPV